jgi:hypothetical protein
MIDFLRRIFGCRHRKTTWPQGRPGEQTVTCLSGCGRTFHYLWGEMRVGKPIQDNEPLRKSNLGQGD